MYIVVVVVVVFLRIWHDCVPPDTSKSGSTPSHPPTSRQSFFPFFYIPFYYYH